MPRNFRCQTFVAVSWNLGGNFPVVDDVSLSQEQETYCTTSTNENCMDFEFHMDRSSYIDMKQTHLAMKLKIFKGCSHETYYTKEIKMKHKEEAKVDEEP